VIHRKEALLQDQLIQDRPAVRPITVRTTVQAIQQPVRRPGLHRQQEVHLQSADRLPHRAAGLQCQVRHRVEAADRQFQVRHLVAADSRQAGHRAAAGLHQEVAAAVVAAVVVEAEAAGNLPAGSSRQDRNIPDRWLKF
jgi:hypothetical protein